MEKELEYNKNRSLAIDNINKGNLLDSIYNMLLALQALEGEERFPQVSFCIGKNNNLEVHFNVNTIPYPGHGLSFGGAIYNNKLDSIVGIIEKGSSDYKQMSRFSKRGWKTHNEIWKD